MKRRKFLKTSVKAAAISGLMSHLPLRNVLSRYPLDEFGGWTGKKFQATGFFRIEKDKRWWLVSPKGNAFLSFGINHLHQNWWNQDYNQEAWKKRLKLESLNGSEFNPALRNWFLEICKEYGFNSVGVHNSLDVINSPRPGLPYMRPIKFINVPHWRRDVSDEDFLDVFSDEFALHCDKLAREMAAPLKDDPYLLGYAMTDCPLFTEEDCRARPDVIGGASRQSRIGWPRRLRNMGKEEAGKKAYVELMKEIYGGNIVDFNTVYNTRFDSFDELAIAQQWRPHTDLSNPEENRDNLRFLHLVVKKYYQITRNAIRKYDPNHLFVGDKINANTDSLDTLLSVISPYVDIIFFQMYARFDYQRSGLDRWTKLVDKPFINGDAAFTMLSENMPRPYGPIADNIEERAEWTSEFFRKSFARPEFVGWHYCGLIDAPTLVPGKERRQHSGMMNGIGEPYPLLKNVLKDNSSRLYELASLD